MAFERDSRQDSPPFWLWPNLLSLDAPIVAVLWQDFLAYRFELPLRPAWRLVLGLTVWAIYLLDRLLDARQPPAFDEPARHRFYRRYRNAMAVLLGVVLAADAIVALGWLRPALLREGLVALAGVLAYLAAFHVPAKAGKLPKEIAAAVLFTAGTFLTAWIRLPCLRLAWAALAFFILCLANMIAIETWEWRELPKTRALAAPPHVLTRWLGRTYLVWVPLAVMLCVIAGRNEWYASIALSAAACALLYAAGRHVSLEARRALVDGVLLTPILFLILR
jgi:hypothetical protein